MSKSRTMRLSEIANIITGATPSSKYPEAWGHEIPFITPSDQIDSMREATPTRFLSAYGAELLEKRLIPAGTTNLTCIGSTIGKVSMAMSPAVTNQQINSIIAKSDIADPTFVYYMIKNWSGILKVEAAGSATPIINKTVLSNYFFKIPPLSEQRAIAEVLGALDDKIAANNGAEATSRSLAQARFDALLRGKTSVAPLRSVLRLEYGKSLPASKRVSGDINVFGSGGIVGSHNEFLRTGPGVIVGRKGSVGSVHWSETDFFPIDTTYYVIPKSSDISLLFCYHLLSSLPLADMNSDSAVPGLNREEALSLPVRIPEPEPLIRFSEETSQLFSFINQLSQENLFLISTRDALLPQLMSGKIRVRDAEAVVEDVL